MKNSAQRERRSELLRLLGTGTRLQEHAELDGSFFRKEVADARSSQWYGGIRLKPPRIGAVVATLSVSLLGLLLALLFFGTYTKTLRVQGTLVPNAGLVESVSPTASVVTRLYVRQGDRVAKGALLAELSADVATPLGTPQEAVARQVAQNVESLHSDLEAGSDAGRLDQAALEQQIVGNARQRSALATQLKIQRERVQSATDLYEKWEASSITGVVSKSQLLQQKDTVLRGRSELADMTARQSDLDTQAARLEGELKAAPLRQKRADNETRRQLIELSTLAAAIAAISSAQLRATSDGVVTTIAVHPGQHVDANEVIVTTLPSASLLIAELWVSPSSIGLVEAGTPVRIRYDTYPYQRYGIANGYVLSVSQSAISPMNSLRGADDRAKPALYRVDVALQHQDVGARGSQHALMPGMSLSADLLLGKARLVDALLDPLDDAL